MVDAHDRGSVGHYMRHLRHDLLRQQPHRTRARLSGCRCSRSRTAAASRNRRPRHTYARFFRRPSRASRPANCGLAQYSGVTSLSATEGRASRNSTTPTSVNSGMKYSRIMRPIMLPTDSRQRLGVGVGDKNLSTRRHCERRRRAAAAARPLDIPSGSRHRSGLRFRLIGKKPCSPASFNVSEPLLTPATPIGG